MGYFDEEKNVQEYIKMADGFDGRELIDFLVKFLDEGSSLLELGMGPGKDLDILGDHFKVTGSDLSKVFLDLYLKKEPGADVIELDAVTLDTRRKWDCIYSNKVLHHLSREDLERSFKRQWEVLNEGGLLFHSFWKGDKEEWIGDMRFIYYVEKDLEKLTSSSISN